MSVSTAEMAVNITRELYKVVTLMGRAGRQVADLFRQADDAQARGIYSDLLDVNRDFLSMVGVLHGEYALDNSSGIWGCLE